MPIDAVAMHIIHPEPIRSGFRPDRSTTNNDAKLLSICTDPTITPARFPSIELPILSKGKDFSFHYILRSQYRPEARNISTVKKITESMPLNCCISSNVSPMPNGFKTGPLSRTSNE